MAKNSETKLVPPDGSKLGVTLEVLLGWSLGKPKGEVVRCSDGVTEGCAANLVNREVDR